MSREEVTEKDNIYARAYKGRAKLQRAIYTPGTRVYWRTAPKSEIGTSEIPGFRALPEGVSEAIYRLKRSK